MADVFWFLLGMIAFLALELIREEQIKSRYRQTKYSIDYWNGYDEGLRRALSLVNYNQEGIDNDD